MTAYYEFIDRSETEGIVTAKYISTIHAQGAWNDDEQHMGPATGIICTELEQFSPRDDMRIGRISLDILGMIHFGEIEITTKVIRAGRTIELIESVLSTHSKTGSKVCLIARVWRMITSDTSMVHGLEDEIILQPQDLPNWDGLSCWGGRFISSLVAHADADNRKGKGIVWVHAPFDMVEGQATSDFVKLMGVVDIANGIVPRIEQDVAQGHVEWIFPNIDLQIHMHRFPEGQWLGLETVQQIGTDGIGLTSSVLHDIHGAFGRSEQILTVREM